MYMNCQEPLVAQVRAVAIENAQLAQRVDGQAFELVAQLGALQLDDHGRQRSVLAD